MNKFFLTLTAIVSLGINTGCTPQIKPAENKTTNSSSESHEHASVGPHHGSLIELGNEEFHAEMVHDEQSVTIYILDSAAKTTVPIDAAELTINVIHEGTPEQFKLPASPEAGDPTGKSSRFTLADADLAGHIDDVAAPKISVTIDGTSFQGEIKHSHD